MKRLLPIIGLSLPLCIACSPSPQQAKLMQTEAPIYPEYKEVTLPCNMAPVRFGLADSCSYDQALAIYSAAGKEVVVSASHGSFDISFKLWKQLLEAGKQIQVRIQIERQGKWLEYNPFSIYISPDSIDSHLAYRLIEPGYEYWYEMGLYQRNLENYDETSIINNRQTYNGCMNCHSFHQHNPDEMLFHLRKDFGGTYMVRNGETEKLPTGQHGMPQSLVYPYWHPSGKYVAFSTNQTKQVFHVTNKNRIEVFDYTSDVVVYDIDNQKIITSDAISGVGHFETFPTFSPDGKTLYFCAADSLKMPDSYDSLRYSLCSVSFDAEAGKVGSQVDTLFNSNTEGKSISFPRVSPDGKRLVFTRAAYGTFSIWHRDADLYELDLTTNEIKSLDMLNSDEVESYHSWSSNGRWMVFSSRRMDGMYTRPFITHVDEAGNYSKPFPVPQSDAHYYDRLMKSFNIPEFIQGAVETGSSKMLKVINPDR